MSEFGFSKLCALIFFNLDALRSWIVIPLNLVMFWKFSKHQKGGLLHLKTKLSSFLLFSLQPNEVWINHFCAYLN